MPNHCVVYRKLPYDWGWSSSTNTILPTLYSPKLCLFTLIQNQSYFYTLTSQFSSMHPKTMHGIAFLFKKWNVISPRFVSTSLQGLSFTHWPCDYHCGKRTSNWNHSKGMHLGKISHLQVQSTNVVGTEKTWKECYVVCHAPQFFQIWENGVAPRQRVCEGG